MRNEIKSTIPDEFIPYTLPDNWKWYFWGDLIDHFQTGLVRSNRELGEGNVYYLKMGDLNAKGICSINNLIKTKADETEIEEFGLKENDFLINVRNTFELVGKTCVIGKLQNEVVLFNHMLVRVKMKQSIPPHFINAFLNIPSSKNLISRCKQGTTTVIALNRKELYKLPIAIPDKTNLEYISNLYITIKRKIELNNRINTELEAMAKTIYDYWFVQFDFPGANDKPYKSSGGKMVYSKELKREIPAGWEVKKMGDILKTVLGGTPSTEVKEYWLNGEYHWLNSGEIANFPIITSELKISKKAIENSATYLMPKGSVALSITRHIRPTILAINSCANQSVIGILENDNYKSSFIYPMIKNEIPRYLSLRTGAQQPHINKQTIDNTLMLSPKENVLSDYYLNANPLYEKIINNAFQNQQLASLRDWLLPMLMNGQVTVK